MKFKTTKKEILNSGGTVVRCGYCALQILLINHEPDAYCKGVYGWNFDVYNVYGLTICTGYRSLPGKDLKGVFEFEKKAEKIMHIGNKMAYDEKRRLVEELLIDFCKLNGGGYNE